MSADPNPGQGPVFVERRTYRRRRLVDAARLLPLLGVALVCLPLLWIGEGASATSTTYAMIYFFCLWVALVVATGLLARHLKDVLPTGSSTDTDGDGSAGGT